MQMLDNRFMSIRQRRGKYRISYIVPRPKISNLSIYAIISLVTSTKLQSNPSDLGNGRRKSTCA